MISFLWIIVKFMCLIQQLILHNSYLENIGFISKKRKYYISVPNVTVESTSYAYIKISRMFSSSDLEIWGHWAQTP